ncbi:DUF3151 domain-containing protein [Nocardiopsis ansamitocini]|uniref:DUF3151 domain-containing protein n=1 Tax=Nocardiopsis ansamitocini TaxID=1670832 RepID=A0A9W6UKB1_9ACTN|nr:DUF3151 domain-containing protein [Nocardiopsis ansamitocini]GLU49759.1 hypothetical protein Nans01_41100 [Nocardiopsis ansamitocini]
MDLHQNLLGGPPPTELPDHPTAREALAASADPAPVAARFPEYSAAWAALAERAYEAGDDVATYAYARTGYHRGLDQLRRSGWKGHGPVPWQHEPNRGFLRSLYFLGKAAEGIEETEEAQRCATFLQDSSEEAAAVLNGRPNG